MAMEPGTRITVRVVPRSGRDGVEPDPADGSVLLVRTRAVPEDGKANDSVRRILGKHLGIAPTRLELIAGHSSRRKVFRVVD
jgi:uncharacterized protein YggU (UPF0235/DUF167 family)